MLPKFFKKQETEPEVPSFETQQMAVAKQQVMEMAGDPADDQVYEQIQERRADFLKWQQDLGDEVKALVMTLKGYSVDESGKYVKVAEPLCNDKFIFEVVIPQCQPFFSRHMINSRFNESRVLMMLKSTANDICDAMADSWVIDKSSYGINFMDFDLVLRTIKNAIIPGPYRALEGWTKKTDSTVHKSIEANTGTTTPKQKGGVQNVFKQFAK